MNDKPVSMEALLINQAEERIRRHEQAIVEAETNLKRIALIYGGQISLFAETSGVGFPE